MSSCLHLIRQPSISTLGGREKKQASFSISFFSLETLLPDTAYLHHAFSMMLLGLANPLDLGLQLNLYEAIHSHKPANLWEYPNDRLPIKRLFYIAVFQNQIIRTTWWFATKF